MATTIMATFLGDVQYSQVMGHLPTPEWDIRHKKKYADSL